MPLLGFQALHTEADLGRSALSVVAAGGADTTVIAALRTASDRGWVRAILVGNEATIRETAASIDIDLAGFSFVHAEDADIARAAVSEVTSGRAAILMKGRVSTPELMQAILDSENGLRSGQPIAQAVLMEIPRDDRRFIMADTGIMTRPNVVKKVELLKMTVTLARSLGTEIPKVAMMSASEKLINTLPDTLDAAELALRSEHGEFPDCVVRGPLSFDLAYAPKAADRKGIANDVVGAADIMIFPDLNSANLTVKAIMYTADCRFGGILLGTTHPVAFMSRADDVPTRLNSLALALRTISA